MNGNEAHHTSRDLAGNNSLNFMMEVVLESRYQINSDSIKLHRVNALRKRLAEPRKL